MSGWGSSSGLMGWYKWLLGCEQDERSSAGQLRSLKPKWARNHETCQLSETRVDMRMHMQ